MQKNQNYHTAGFTLVELLIVLGIFGMILFVTGTIVFETITQKTKSTTIQEVGFNGQMVMTSLTNSVRSAISVIGPTQGTTSTSLVLETSAGQITWFVQNGRIWQQQGSNTPVAISATDSVISDLVFENVSYPDTPGSIRISFEIAFDNQSGRREYFYQESFTTTVTLRKQ